MIIFDRVRYGEVVERVMTKKIFLSVLIVFALLMIQGVAAGECYESVSALGDW